MNFRFNVLSNYVLHRWILLSFQGKYDICQNERFIQSDSQCSKKTTNKSRHRLQKQSIGSNQHNTFGSKCEKHNNKDIQNYIHAHPPSTH